MEENKNYTTEENLPKPESMKKMNRKVSAFTWLIIVVGVLNLVFMQTKISLIFSVLFIILCVIAVVNSLKNRAKK